MLWHRCFAIYNHNNFEMFYLLKQQARSLLQLKQFSHCEEEKRLDWTKQNREMF